MKCRIPFTAWWSLLTTRAKSLRYMLPWARGMGIWGWGRDGKRQGRKLGKSWAEGGQGQDSESHLPPSQENSSRQGKGPGSEVLGPGTGPW